VGHLAVDGRIILKCILKKKNLKLWAEFNWINVVSADWLLRIR
jgi:hypothetical protein